MKKLINLLFILGLIANLSFAQDVDITFSVDISEVVGTPASPTVSVFGSFNGWDPSVNPMADDDGDGIWTATLPLAAGDYEYKYFITGGDGSTLEETLTPGDPCTSTFEVFTNRTLSATETTALPLVCWESCNDCDFVTPMVDITFLVDISEVAEAPVDGVVSIFGSFNGWDPGANPMADEDGDGIWLVTLPLEVGDYEYKYFITGSDGSTLEESLTPGDPCTTTFDIFTNRTLAVTADSGIEPLVCWNSCNDCDFVVPTSMVTFVVNMNDYGPIDEARLAGSFNGWDASSNPMTDEDGDGVWETTLELANGDYQYKFVANFEGSDDFEDLFEGQTCTISEGGFTNRLVSVGEDATLPTVCYGSCDDCGLSEMVSITFNVGTSHIDVSPDGIFIAGGGNFGVPGDNQLTDEDGDGIYSITIMRPVGFESFYTFANGNCPDFSCKEDISGQECANPDAFNDRLLPAVTEDTVISTCFGICTTDTNCDVVIPTSMVTFVVNMNDYGPIDEARLAGSFNGWDAGSNPMTDDDGDGIWETTIELNNTSYQYKFVALVGENNDFEDLVEGQSCTITEGGFTNRIVNVSEDATLSTVCYGSCNDCGDTSDMVSITFNLGTNHIDVSPDGVYIAGGGNFGVPGDNQLTDDDGDGVYSITIMRPMNFSSFYTFANGNCPDFSCKENIAGQDCSDPDNFDDRFLMPVTQDTVLSTCFGICTTDTNCEVAPEANITFSVDINQLTGVPADPVVSVFGSFNGWDPGVNPMADDDGDGVWMVTLPLPAGDYEYKYFITGADGSTLEEELEPGSDCTLTTDIFTNRTLAVTETTAIPTVCWNSCEACVVAVDELLALGIDFRVRPTIANNEVQLSFGKQLPVNSFLRVMNVNGQVVQQLQMSQLDNYRLDVSSWSAGMYFLQLQLNDAIAVRRMIKQ